MKRSTANIDSSFRSPVNEREEVLYEQEGVVGVKIMTGKPLETADSSSCTVDWELGSLHKTELSLHVSDTNVTWSVCGAPVRGTRIYPWCVSWHLGVPSFPYGGMPCSVSVQLVEPQLDVPGFFDSSWKALPFLVSGLGVDWWGRWERKGGWEGSGNCGWYVKWKKNVITKCGNLHYFNIVLPLATLASIK